MALRHVSRAVDRVAWGFQVIAECALAGLLLLVAHEVFARYVLNAPTQFSVEFSEYLLLLMTFASSAWVLRRNRHVRVLFVVEAMSPRWRAASDMLVYALLLAFCCILVRYGGAMSWTAFAGDDRSSSLIAFPLWIPYAFIPLGGLALSLQCAVRLGDACVRFRGGASLFASGSGPGKG